MLEIPSTPPSEIRYEITKVQSSFKRFHYWLSNFIDELHQLAKRDIDHAKFDKLKGLVAVYASLSELWIAESETKKLKGDLAQLYVGNEEEYPDLLEAVLELDPDFMIDPTPMKLSDFIAKHKKELILGVASTMGPTVVQYVMAHSGDESVPDADKYIFLIESYMKNPSIEDLLDSSVFD